jgi:hypothetical protein
MAKTLTLEEAAQQLGLTAEQFKTNLKTHKDFKAVRPLMGGATMHFREQDIEELARKLGLGSEPELQLGSAGSDPDVGAGLGASDQIEIGRDPPRPGGSSSRHSNPAGKRPQAEVDSSDDFVPLTSDSGKKKGDVPRDSGARIESKTTPHGGQTENIDLEAEGRKSGSGKGEVFKVAPDSGPKSGKSSSKTGKSDPKKKKPGSEFELQLGTDSDSEFELTLADDSDEVQLGASPPRDATGKSGKSGVNLKKPADSGISLEKGEDESDFELNLDSASAHKVSGGPRSSKKSKKDSESEFELSLDDSSGEVAPLGSEEGKDIFATDFDIPALDDSGSEAVVLEDSDTALESSDFDLEDSAAVDADESASEVVQLDDDLVDEEGRSSSKRRKRGEDDVSAEEALADIDEEDEEAELEPAPATVAAPARWGPLPALVLFPCLFIMMIIMFMGFELLHGMWSYRSGGSKPTYTITRGIAGMFKDKGELPND